MTPQRIGIYPGTFDPVHNGHIAFALAAQGAQALDTVMFLPEAQPRSKQKVTALAHRLELLNHATLPYRHIAVLSLADKRFTVDNTLPELLDKFGGAELYLLIGSDVAKGLSRPWPGMAQLLQHLSLIIGLRAGDDEAEVSTILQQLSTKVGFDIRATFVSTQYAGVRSSAIRAGDFENMAEGGGHYARRHDLYGGAG